MEWPGMVILVIKNTVQFIPIKFFSFLSWVSKTKPNHWTVFLLD